VGIGGRGDELAAARSVPDLPCAQVLTDSVDEPARLTSMVPNGRAAVTLFAFHGPADGEVGAPGVARWANASDDAKATSKPIPAISIQRDFMMASGYFGFGAGKRVKRHRKHAVPNVRGCGSATVS
jgi:hypothetical protein